MPQYDTVKLEPLAVGARQAAEMIGVSERTWRAMDASGEVPKAMRLGRRKLWRVDDIRQWFDAGMPKQ